MARFFKSLVAALSLVVLPLVLLCALELSYRAVKSVFYSKRDLGLIFPQDIVDIDSDQYEDSYTMRVLRKKGEEVHWDARYRIKKGVNHRIFFEEQDRSQKNSHVNLLGGSFTFGVNLNDDETLGGFFKEYIDNSYFINNFGIPGAGPPQILQFLDLFKNTITSNTSGKTFYFFIDDHIPRAIMDLQHIDDMAVEPRYEVGQDGELVYAGPFLVAKPIMTAFLKLVGFFSILRKLGFNPPIGDISNINSSHKDYVCSLIEGIKKRSIRSFPQTVFSVVFLPKEGRSLYLLRDCLVRLKVNYIDLTSLIDLPEIDNEDFFRYYFPDFHPRGKFNKAVVKRILKDYWK